MTLNELRTIIKRENGSLNFELYSSAFEGMMLHNIYVPTLNWNSGEKETNEDKLITPYIVECINSFRNLKKEDFIDDLQNEIFRLFNNCIEVTSYGQVPDDLIEEHGNTEANRIFFKGNTKESVYQNCRFDTVSYDNDNSPANCFSVFASIDWDIEHGLIIHFANGKFVEIE
jgi:hypothetical protein